MPATPFHQLLDSATPPAPRPERFERPDRGDRRDTAGPSNDRNVDAPRDTKDSADAKSTKGSNDATNAKDTQQADDAAETAVAADGNGAPGAEDASATKAVAQAMLAAAASVVAGAKVDAGAAADADDNAPKGGSEADPSADATDPKVSAHVTAEIPVIVVDAAPALTLSDAAAPAADTPADAPAENSDTPAIAAPTVADAAPVASPAPAITTPVATTPATPAADPASKPDPLAALLAAGQQSAADGAAKPARAQSTKAHGDISLKGPSTGDLQPASPQIEPGKDGEALASGEKAPVQPRHASSDLLPKLDLDAQAPRPGDAAGALKAGAEVVQNLGLTAPASHTAVAAATAANAATAPNVPVPLAGLAVAIATQAHAGNRRFEIRLDPAELGRIDVRLEIDRDGNVTSRLVADRQETLDLLKRDASQLERALQQAGLKTSDNALEFSLRQQGFARDDNDGTQQQNSAQLIAPDDDTPPLDAMRQRYGRLLGLGGGLDIKV